MAPEPACSQASVIGDHTLQAGTVQGDPSARHQPGGWGQHRPHSRGWTHGRERECVCVRAQRATCLGPVGFAVWLWVQHFASLSLKGGKNLPFAKGLRKGMWTSDPGGGKPSLTSSLPPFWTSRGTTSYGGGQCWLLPSSVHSISPAPALSQPHQRDGATPFAPSPAPCPPPLRPSRGLLHLMAPRLMGSQAPWRGQPVSHTDRKQGLLAEPHHPQH